MPASTLYDLMVRALGNDFDSATYQQTAVIALSDGAADMLAQITMPAQEDLATVTVVAGTQSYLLPSDTRRIVSVVDSTGDYLEAVEPTQIDVGVGATGVPRVYAISGANLLLWPTPTGNGSLTVRYTSEPDMLGIGLNESVSAYTGIPERYLRALVSFSRAHLFAMEDDPEMSAFWRAEYERDLNRMRGDVQFRGGRRKQRRNIFARDLGPTFRRP